MTNLASSTSFDVGAEVTGAYAAWDSAFNKADAKAVAATYISNCHRRIRSYRVRKKSRISSLGCFRADSLITN